jgi:hypothetical protein
MTPPDQDFSARLLSGVVQLMPPRRRDWGRAMQAELAAIDARPDRREFAIGCARAAAADPHLLRGAVHLLVVLGTLGTVLAWIAAIDFLPLEVILYVVVPVLAAVCWTARRAGMLGPAGSGVTAWLLRGGGYLLAGGIAAAGLAHRHPATLEAADDGTGVLVFSVIGAGILLAVPTVWSRRSAATTRVLITGLGSGLNAALIWVVVVLVVPPIPATVGWALVATGLAGVIAAAANSGRAGSTAGCLLATLLATTTTLLLIFAGVVLLARFGPDSVIPAITPHALPGHEISESRIEIVDPYVLVIVLGGLAATTLAAAGVLTRRRAVVSS